MEMMKERDWEEKQVERKIRGKEFYGGKRVSSKLNT